MKQGQYSPSPVGEQVAMIFGSINGMMDDVPVKNIKEYETEFLTLLKATKPEVIESLAQGKMDKEITKAGRPVSLKYSPIAAPVKGAKNCIGEGSEAPAFTITV